ncbi:MAG: type II toxin-antitoxin system RelE/ParE family toxin [Gammaproteobacteria bacterium]|nr:type II toxin-antitoxin system RelE/ParE family toxin [Rhodoferax sp.]MBU3898355.1 type II toxin-antitoxin system RelE/ParE family toxin [Gammaproteobacteria bacterium]MBA3059380.1 type II toxin-antitoxin system RelE/ParE family toxin [Rhodoferax sp.]MBU3996957.1 type II toxin-antitoxin system RelE/ParE family toxin [Gammaproteobacteria bacterium]MBU4019596.1 type II toxin-antitoxin system RelE/ParE family toxin [Gammaproteobacteria bacterium]MBU4079129.1 type II toxin-antitoxin system RelE
MMYEVEFSEEADADLERLFDFALQRELNSESGDLDAPGRAIQAIRNGVAFLKSSPFTCRKVGASPFIRELVISFGSTGYVALFEIVDGKRVIMGALRHQREDDYH